MTILAAFSFYTKYMLLFREALVRIFCHSIIIGLDFDNSGHFWSLTTACSFSFDLLVGVIVVVEGPLSWWWIGLLVGWLVGWMHWSKVTQLVSDRAKYTNYKYSPHSIDLRPFWRGVGFDKYISAFPVFCFQKPFPLPGVHQKRTREGKKGALGNLSTARHAAQIRKYFSAAFSQRVG